MARYGRDFMGRVRGMWDRFSGDSHGPMGRPRTEAMGPGGEGYFLTPDMARHASYSLDYSDHGRGDGGGRGFPPGGMAQFGRAGAGRGYGGDYRTGRGGYDAGEFFVNRTRGADTGYHPGYERDLGMRRGMAAGGRGYGADYDRGPAMGYDRGYRGAQPGRATGYNRDYRDGGQSYPSFPRTWGR
jgi:hypothetical protein